MIDDVLRTQLTYDTQVQMVWPPALLASVPHLPPVTGLRLHTYQPGEEEAFFALMHAVGWTDWDEAKLAQWMPRILPDGWFFLVDEGSGERIATTMTVHSHAPDHPFGGELGWVAVHPAYQGRNLSSVVVIAALRRLIAGKYRNIHLYSEDYRLPALKTYLRLGFVPYLYAPDMPARWQRICELVGWPYTPETWRLAD